MEKRGGGILGVILLTDYHNHLDGSAVTSKCYNRKEPVIILCVISKNDKQFHMNCGYGTWLKKQISSF